MRAVAELRDGSDDYPDFYCATVEWDWGDGTMSENSSDCDPYEAGKSTIQRRFSAEHIYRQGGAYRVFFRLKQKTKQVAAASTNVTCDREQAKALAGDAAGVDVDAVMAELHGRVRERLRGQLVEAG